MRSGPIYELSVLAPPEGGDEFADALETLVSGMQTDAGISDARLLETHLDGQVGFALQINFDSNEACDEFFAGRSSVLESDIADLGGEQQSARVLKEDDSQNIPGDASCLNCGAPLRGQYCGHCGQRAQGRLISLWELIRDAVGDLFELDSKLWATLLPLLFRPGKLTADYLQGKRARFMPPFRMYLVLSLLFFVVAFFDPGGQFAILYEDPNYSAATETETPDETNTDAAEDDGPNAAITFDGENIEDSDCEVDMGGLDEMPQWIQRRVTPGRLEQVCLEMQADDGEGFKEKMIDTIPAALIVLLPLMAFALQILYPLSRRYYVEHLLFFVHFHAFFFLLLSIQILWYRLIAAVNLHEAIGVLPIIATSFYIPIYLFKAIRRVYGQGFFLTLFKYLILLVVYTAGFSLTMLGALAIAAFSEA